jgi:hypothetical protein
MDEHDEFGGGGASSSGVMRGFVAAAALLAGAWRAWEEEFPWRT